MFVFSIVRHLSRKPDFWAVHPASGGWRPLYAGRWAYTSNFVKHILFFKIKNYSPDQATISNIIRLLSLWFMCKNNNRLISDEQKILQTISLQNYVKRLWNHSNTKIPVTIGKGTATAKPRSKAPHAGQWGLDSDVRQWGNKYSLLMHGIKMKSPVKFMFELITSVYELVYIFSIW